MRHTHSYPAVFCVILLTILLSVPCFPVSVSANSAQSRWTGTTAAGAIVEGDSCPVVVEKELLTFELPEFPPLFYETASDFLNYRGRVTAEYTFYNPAEYSVNATLVFPFGTVPDYGFFYDRETGEAVLNTDTEKYEVTVRGESVSKTLRHTFMLSGSQFDLEEDMAKLHEGYVDDLFYSPELSVTRYVYQASGTDVETYPAATAAFVLSADPEETKVFMENQSGFADLGDGGRLDTWVDPETAFSVYVIGMPLDRQPDWKFYENGACENEIGGTMNLVNTETMTFKEFALSEYDDTAGILDYDWYNAVVSSLNYFAGEYGAIHSPEMCLDVSESLMRWYQYEIMLEPGERIVNTVTAPMYPTADTASEPPVYEYTYLLSPARSWADFGTLDIVIHTPYEMTQEGAEDYDRTDAGYEQHFESLPERELMFTLCEEAEPTTPARDAGESLPAGMIPAVFIAAAVIFAAVVLIRHIKIHTAY